MSFIHDKVKCQGNCGLLYDADLLNAEGVCRDCVTDEAMMREAEQDALRDGEESNLTGCLDPARHKGQCGYSRRN